VKEIGKLGGAFSENPNHNKVIRHFFPQMQLLAIHLNRRLGSSKAGDVPSEELLDSTAI
jgi:hypothetical protein